MFGDFKDLLAFRDIYKRAPQKVPRISAAILNDMAFETRTAAIDNINHDMTIRRPNFVRRQMRVSKASPSRQVARVGSLPLGNFSGWAEQETGQQGDRSRFATIEGRRGSRRNIIPPRFRLNKSFPTQGNTRIGAFLAIMERQKGKKPFIMKGGLFKFVGKRKIRMLQGFERPAKTRRTQWMKRAVGSVDPSNRIWKKFLLTLRK